MGPISSILPPSGLPSALDGGLATIQAGSRQLSQDAEQIANPDNADLTAPLAGLAPASQLAEAGAAVVRASDQMLGTLLDMFA
ncbi:MAG TPA: hypothetical protein VME42_04560 [Steroidobacteraceae bacterium]|nr:hypothetical protein [Steroidobacteraceae bacterium]